LSVTLQIQEFAFPVKAVERAGDRTAGGKKGGTGIFGQAVFWKPWRGRLKGDVIAMMMTRFTGVEKVLDL
jgi:hypothetical protein